MKAFLKQMAPGMILLPILLCSSGEAASGSDIFFDIETRMSYEDNVLGISSEKRAESGSVSKGIDGHKGKMAMGQGGQSGSPVSGAGASAGDFSLSVMAGAGLIKPVSFTEDAYALFRGYAGRSAYAEYGEFDSTVLGISAGLRKGLGRALSMTVSLKGKLKDFEDAESDAKALRMEGALSQHPNPKVSLRESLSYEFNFAASEASSYGSAAFLIGADLYLIESFSFLLEYEYMKRSYEDPQSDETISYTFSAGVERAIGRHWSMDFRYDRQSSDYGGASVTDNILSAGLRYGI